MQDNLPLLHQRIARRGKFQEFARAAGAPLGTVRKWERGERSPSGAARMLVRILARDPALVIAEAGLAEGRRKRRGGEAA